MNYMDMNVNMGYIKERFQKFSYLSYPGDAGYYRFHIIAN